LSREGLIVDVVMKMPDLATVGSDLKVIRWLVEAGQPIRRGEPLLEVETDKATVVVESTVTGTLKSMAVAADETVATGAVIATFDAEDAPPPSAEIAIPRVEPSSPMTPIVTPPRRSDSLFARNRQAARVPKPEDQQ
jgi:pyruvate dehydrogenase E2 component (dihydrolipoamide acetyltransferase)